MTVYASKPEINVREKLKELEGVRSETLALGTIDNPFVSVLQAESYNLPAGVYWFKNSNNQQQQLFYKDGWVLIASNNAKDSVIPGGQARNDLAYTVHRNSTFGALGTPSPESDYIIGDFITSFGFTQGRILGWGWGSTNGTYSYYPTENLGTYIELTWPVTSLDTVTPRASVSIVGSVPELAAYFVLDAVRFDVGLNANANQSTVGGAGLVQSSGDPSGGCYIGHGNTEGSYEGWYPGSGNPLDSQGYTTWVK